MSLLVGEMLIRVPECDEHHDYGLDAFIACIQSLEALPLPIDEFAVLRAILLASLQYHCSHESGVARFEAKQFVRRLRRIARRT